jgi:hypothetical protein
MVDKPEASKIRMAKMYQNLGKNLDHHIESAFDARVSWAITHSWYPRLDPGVHGKRGLVWQEQWMDPFSQDLSGLCMDPG